MATLREIMEADLVANPDDLATHMAYADLLQEADDPRGELIQLQLAMEQLPSRSGKRLGLRRRIHRLMNEHVHTWLGELHSYLLGVPHTRATPYEFARGWLDTLHVENLGVELARTIGRSPEVRLLRVLRIDEVMRERSGEYSEGDDVPLGLPYPSLAVLAQAPILGNVQRLEVISSPNGIDGQDVTPLLNSPHLKRLTSLRLRLPVFSYLECELLMRSALFPRLRELELTECYLLDLAARMLARANLKHLTRLNVDGNNLTEVGIAALRATGVNLEVGTQHDPDDVPF